MVFIWFSYGFPMVFTGFPGGQKNPTDSPRHAGAGGWFDRPMEGRNDLDIDPGYLAFCNILHWL